MTVSPEDLCECWHLITASGDDPVGWEMDQAMWDAIVKARDAREPIDAGDSIDESGMILLGTPVEITNRFVPILIYRRDGEKFVTPILGSMDEISPAIARSHGRGTDARR